MAELYLAPLKRIIHKVKKTGRKPAIGNHTLEFYRDEVERYAEQLAEEAAVLAAEMGRTTIKTHDIEVAAHKIQMTVTYEPELKVKVEAVPEEEGYDIY